MKKTIALILTLLACLVIGGVNKAEAAETTLKPYEVYGEDFEGYTAGTTGNEINADKHLFWFEGNNISVATIEEEQNSLLKYTITDGSAQYIQLGGIGTRDIGNLEDLVAGKKYHLSMYVDMSGATPGSVFFVEYQSTIWIGAKISNTGVTACDANNISNLTYVNNVLEFDFVACNIEGNMNRGWIKLTAKDMSTDDYVVIDDFKITESLQSPIAFSLDFESYEVGAAATTSATNIKNIWNNNVKSLSVAEEENGNKYLNVSHSTTSTGYPKFYFNKLPLVSGKEYRLEFDILSHNFMEFYLAYYSNSDSSLTYSYTPTGFKYEEPVGPMGETTFDGKHVSLVFTPNTSYGEHWAQIVIVGKHTNEGNMKIDNIVIYENDFEEPSAKSITANAISQHTVGKELDLSELEVTLTRIDDSSRLLSSDEYIVDASQVNKDVAGVYPVTIKVVDEFGNEVSTTVNVEYVAHEHNEVVDAAVAATCTETGLTEGKHCSVCNEVLVAQEEVAAKGHTEVVDAAVAATCTEKGKTEGKHCSVCNEVLVAQEEVAAKGHTEVVDAAVAATCTAKGKTEGKHCSVCNEVLVAQEETAMLDHTYDDEYDANCNACEATREVPEKPAAGCGGSVVATIFGVVALAGATLFIAKRKREE